MKSKPTYYVGALDGILSYIRDLRMAVTKSLEEGIYLHIHSMKVTAKKKKAG